jgi:hypothetical protein
MVSARSGFSLSLATASRRWSGAKLEEAQGALQGDVSGVALGLGVTVNATLTALVSSILVKFFLHQLQQAQDRLVLDAAHVYRASSDPEHGRALTALQQVNNSGSLRSISAVDGR